MLWLTALGAALRLFMPGTPTLEFDEAATYSRVTGSFAEMISLLRIDGFTPLFYEIYWIIGKVLPLGPWGCLTVRPRPKVSQG